MTAVQKRTAEIQKFFGSEYVVEVRQANCWSYIANVYNKSDPIKDRALQYGVIFTHNRKPYQLYRGYRILRYAPTSDTTGYICDRKGITRLETMRPYLVAFLLTQKGDNE